MEKLIKKFEEYTLDVDTGDMAEEYAKLILSTYIDKQDGESLESVYKEVIVGDKLDDQEQEEVIKTALTHYLHKLYKDSKYIRNVLDIESNKYNL